MRLYYIEDIPFDYEKYGKSKDIQLSDKLKTQFNHYYREIKKSDSLSINEWTDMAASIKYSVEAEVCQSGNKKSIYVEDYVQFIYGVSYLFFDKFHLSQSKVSKILGITPTKFSKLDIFPHRSFQAYTKLDDESKRKSLIPNNVDSNGICIAECINRKIQTKYACCGFFGVSNDLDLFVNISATDKKRYIMTIPIDYSRKMEVAMGYARFLFATANNLENVQGNYVAGKIKEKIIELIKRQYKVDLSYSQRMKNLLANDDKCWDFFLDKAYIEDELNRYRFLKLILDEIYENEELPELDLYDDSDLIELPDELAYSNENYDEVVKWLEQSIIELEQVLISNMSYAKKRKYNKTDFTDYRLCLYQELIEKLKVNHKSSSIMCTTKTEDEKILYAAIFWIFSVFGVDEIEEKRYKEILQYIKSKKLLDYFDAINKEFGKDKQSHTFLNRDNFDIVKEVGHFCDVRGKQHRPVMLYVDTAAYPNIKKDMDRLINDNWIVLIVHDTSGIISGYSMKELDKNLNLYYMEGKKNVI